MATAPIITIAWQQPAKWIGVEEHVRRGRIRNKGELTAGMIVQVMYKKGWYKAKVINPDPLRTRNRTKKSCTCCISPAKHTHSARGKDRRRSNKANQQSNNGSDVTPQANKNDAGTEVDLKADSDAKPSEAENLDLMPSELADSGTEGSILGNGELEQEDIVSEDLQHKENISGTDSVQGDITVEKNQMQSNANPKDDGRNVSDELACDGSSMKTHSGTDAVQDEIGVKENGQEMIESHTESNVAGKNSTDKATEEPNQTPEQANQIVEPDQITEEPEQIAEAADQNAVEQDTNNQTAEEQVTDEQVTDRQVTDRQVTNGEVRDEEVMNEKVGNEDIRDEEVKNEQVGNEDVRDDVTNEQVTNELVMKEQVTKEQVTNEQATNEQVTNEQVTNEQVANEQVTNEQVTNEQVTNEQVTNEQVTNEQDTNEQDRNEQVTNEQVTNEQVTNEQVTNEQVTNEQVTNEQVTNEQVTNEQVTNEQLTNEQVTDREVAKEQVRNGHVRIEEVRIAEDTNEQVRNEVTNEQVTDDQPTKDQTACKLAACTTREQIAKEHMYSQPMPVQEEVSKEIKMTKHLEIRIDKLKIPNCQPEINSDHDKMITGKGQSHSEQLGQSTSETPLPAESKTVDNLDAVSVESETPSTADTTDVNVVYVRPSDIHMLVNKPQTNDEKETNNQGDNKVEDMECEPTVESRNQLRGIQSSVEKPEAMQSSTDQGNVPVQLEMAHPDEPLGQIKISEPISLATGNVTNREGLEQPRETSTRSQEQKQLESNPKSQEKQCAVSTGHQPQGSNVQSLTKQAEIKHRSKGLVAHQTTLPSGRPGPIILTMKTKKPKHKKSKKKNKHKDKEKDRNKEIVSSPSEPGIPVRSPPSAVTQQQQQQKSAESSQRATGHLQPTGRHAQAAAMQAQAVAMLPQTVAMQPQTVAMQPQTVAMQPQTVAMQPQTVAMQPQTVAMQPQAVAMQQQVVAMQQQAVAMQQQTVSMQQQAAARQSQAIARQSQVGARQAHGRVQSPPNRSVQNPVMRSPNVTVSADGSMRHPVEPIRHIEPPRAHMPPPQRGQAPGGRTHSQSSQPSPTSPPSAHHQWYPVNMPHHPRMAGPPPGHPAHMAPGDFANMRARHQQPYHSGLPSYVEASFAGAPQHMRAGNQHHMSNAPSPAEAAYIRAQSLARHCHHPHWQPNGPPQFIRDPHMAGSPLLRVPRYAHPPYARMPSDIPPGAGRPPPLIPAPGPQPRSIHPVSIHKNRPEGPHPQRSAEIGPSSPTAAITPSSSTSESVQSISPQSAQKRGREPSSADLENMIAQQFQEGSEGERVIGVAELIELRNALRRHHGFADEPPAKSPRLDGTANGNQVGMQCPPMLASIGLQPRPPNPQIDNALRGQAVIGPAVMGNASPPRAQHPPVSVATSNVPHSKESQHVASVQPQHKPTEGTHTGDSLTTSGHQAGATTPQNPARHWVAEAQQLYPRQSVSSQQSPSNPGDGTLQQATPSERPSAAVPVAPSTRPVPPLAPLPKPHNTGRSVQRSGRKQKTPHRRPTVEDIVIIKSEPLSPGYEAEEDANLCLVSNDTIANTANDEQSRPSQSLNHQGSDSMDSVTETGEMSAEQRPSGSGPISQLQTLCTRLSSSRTPIIPPQSIQSAPPIPAHLTQIQHHPIVHPAIESVESSPANHEMRRIPPLMQDIPNQQIEILREQRSNNPPPPTQEPVPPAAVQPRSPVELEPTSSGLNESAPSPDTSSAAKVDKDADVTRRLSFLEREMGIIKSWVWEIRTMLTSRSNGLRKGLPKCTDIGEGNVLVGSGEHTITMARVDYLDCWDKTENAKDLVVKLISKVFTEEELAMSNYNGGMIRSTYKKRLADDPRFNAILAQAEKEYGVGNLEDRKAIREAVNNKCRKKAFKFRQQEAITQRINQQYQMYKE